MLKAKPRHASATVMPNRISATPRSAQSFFPPDIEATHENVKHLRELSVSRNSSSASEISGRTCANLPNHRSSDARRAGVSLYQVTFPTLPKASLSVVLAVLKAPLSVTPKAPIAVSDSKQTSTTINAYSPRSCPESSFHRFGISVSPFVLTSLGWRQSRD
jgi:hypothetical protein